MADVAAAIVEATIKSGGMDRDRSEKIADWLGKYIGDQQLFGLSVKLGELKKDAPQFSSPNGMLAFLAEARDRLSVPGIYLVLDEIDGITRQRTFSHFIKGVVENNATSKEPLPLLLALCGVEERRWDMIRHHQPVERIFSVVDVDLMGGQEMEDFFTKAFAQAGMTVEKRAMGFLTHNSAGFPKIMHEIGDAVFWTDSDGVVDTDDATAGIVDAAEAVGRKYVDRQVVRALRSSDYRSILEKVVNSMRGSGDLAFRVPDIKPLLSESEARKLNNFLQRMKGLKVIRSGEDRGEYVFVMRMVFLHLLLKQVLRSDD